jgi:UrcA family protein
MKLFLIFGAAVSLATSVNAATTGDIVVQQGPSARVSYADLNLGSQAGRETLAGRIEAAADMLCDATSVEPVSLKVERVRCHRVAVDSGNARAVRIGQR